MPRSLDQQCMDFISWGRVVEEVTTVTNPTPIYRTDIKLKILCIYTFFEFHTRPESHSSVKKIMYSFYQLLLITLIKDSWSGGKDELNILSSINIFTVSIKNKYLNLLELNLLTSFTSYLC
jgi:hypothetical protein